MKTLRYAAEFFAQGLVPKKTGQTRGGAAAPLTPPSPPWGEGRVRGARRPLRRIAKIAEGYQELLGNLHDAAVAEETLSKWQRKGLPWDKPAAGRATPGGKAQAFPLCALLKAAHKDQAELRREFGKLWGPKPLKKLERAVKAVGSHGRS